MPKVSIVIPTYNRAGFIVECLESVAAQSFKDYEVIIIDDGSTDNTAEIVSRFKATYVRQENRGVSAARNHGVEIASGEYIAFLDSDDILTDYSLEKRVEILDKHPEAGFSYGQAYFMDATGNVYGLRKSSFLDGSAVVDGKEQIRELLFTNRITLSSLMVRKSCLEEIGGFREEMRSIAEERHLFIRLSKKHPVAYIAEPLVKLRIHQGGLHKNVDPKSGEQAFLIVAKEIYDDPEFAGYFQHEKSQAYYHFYRLIADYAFKKDMKMARNYLKKAVFIYPRCLLSKDIFRTVYMFIRALFPCKFTSGLLNWRPHFLAASKKDAGRLDHVKS